MPSKDDEAVIQMLESFSASVRSSSEPACGLTNVARMALVKGQKLRAFKLAREALAFGHDAEVHARARDILSALIPRYHIPMMNDTRRNIAWDKALRAAIRPGMHVLEIGTGAGMLALMAARAGAEKVITCEVDEVAAELARELAARNGFREKIVVLTKRSQDLMVGPDLERRADLVFCDIFADRFFDFDPLAALSDARKRLLVPDAPAVPATGGLRVALAHHTDYERGFHAAHAAGFDIGPVAEFARTSERVAINDTALKLRSEALESFRFDFTSVEYKRRDRRELLLEATCDGDVNGLAQWITLDLDVTTILEARPEPAGIFFSAPHFYPFAESLRMSKGEKIRVGTDYDENIVRLWQIGRA